MTSGYHRRRVAARLHRFQQELAGLDDEEREQFLLRLSRDSVVNPFTIEDILTVSYQINFLLVVPIGTVKPDLAYNVYNTL